MTALIAYARWLLARSDVVTAYRFLTTRCEGEGEGAELLRYIERYWPHLTDPNAYANVYEVSGRFETAHIVDSALIPQSPRYQMILSVLADRTECETVVDYGCSYGAWAVHLHNELGKRWWLYDIDAASIAAARNHIQAFAQVPSAFELNVTATFPTLVGSVDCVLLLEILEHVRDPISLLRAAERAVRPGGLVLISVPIGPWEYTRWVTEPVRPREHLWELTHQDLLDALKHRPGLYIQSINYPAEQYTGLPLGHLVAVWQRPTTDFEIADFNWSRKLTPFSVPVVRLPGEV